MTFFRCGLARLSFLSFLSLAVTSHWVEASAQEQVTYYYTDAQGTVLAEADAQGNLTRQSDYKPYGQEIIGASTSAKPGYTGHMTDPDTGLVYMKARYYDPDIGRFLSVDVFKASAGDPFSTNLYVYAHAAPSMLTDPDGRQARGGQDMDICNGPVPCDLNISYGTNGNISGPYEKIVDRVFQNYQLTPNRTAVLASSMPAEIRTALIYIIASPLGKGLVRAALKEGDPIKLLDMTSSPLGPNFQYMADVDMVAYTTNLADYKARFSGSPGYAEIKDQTLDVILMHEIGHTSLGRTTFGIGAQPHTYEDEFEDVRKVENPYRSYYGVPQRSSYSGIPLP
ncbi:RHS repeat-associated core domain-containing protein [Luteibacter sp. UNCMF366Tsu5.1]|uniref:RHS repeat-associated core domain-containing protein n=1 Tax=Luteibacter sp. UNCMF366Tsu5.1 TaxID=1502758 RepID=UPI0009089565|nr:RHS repeat-associated core domain-containing protein [Luteibacter sp. UNCMF366Tsu5.1]SFW69147.1 RHS repeat-associated core domain-containing protein [Luteibacter sp. UNCMF366Tsu5.1]